MTHGSPSPSRTTVAAAVLLLTINWATTVSGQSSMFRGDPTHSGTSTSRGPETLGSVAWRFVTGGTVRSTPALAEGVLYFGSADGNLYAVTAEDGAEVWRFDAEAPINSSPALAGDLVVFMDRANTVWALERRTGRPRWQLATGPDLPLSWGHEGWDYLGPSATVASASNGAEILLIGSGNGKLYAIDPATGKVRWQRDTGGRIRATPAVANGAVFLGNGAGIFFALSLSDGTTIWRFETAGVGYDAADFGFDRRQIQSSAAVRDGRVYFGSRDASFYALDAATGDLLWHREDGSAWVVNSPAVNGEMVVTGRSSSTNLRALDPETGDERWVVETGGLVFSSPVLAGGTVYLGTGSGRIHAFDLATGTERWSYRTEAPVHSSPVIAGGRLYIGSDDGSLYALSGGGGASPVRAVYYDSTLMNRSNWGSDPEHRRASEYFEQLGYQVLDLPGLLKFFEDRAADRIPSVVVFGMDALPLEWHDGRPATTWHRYLAAGGKVVWLGHPPLLVVRDTSGSYSVDRERAATFTGIELDGWNGDHYSSHPTESGSAWGLTDWLVENPSANPGAVDIVLRMTENGVASAWVKSFGGPLGTGLVVIPAATDRNELEEIRRVAEFGVMTSRAAME